MLNWVNLRSCYDSWHLDEDRGVVVQRTTPSGERLLEFPSSKDALFGWSWASDSGEDENVKVYGQADGRRTTGDQKFSSVELKRFMLSTNIFVFKFCLTKRPALSTRTIHRVFIRLKYSYQCSLLVLALRIKRSVSSFRGWKGIGCSIITNTTGVN